MAVTPNPSVQPDCQGLHCWFPARCALRRPVTFTLKLGNRYGETHAPQLDRVSALLAWAVPVLTALIAAAPGLAALNLSIKAAGLPLAPVYFALTNFLPALIFSFGVGFVMFRMLVGRRVDLLVASAAPWLLNALYFYVAICVGTPVSCLGPFDLAGYAVVPIALLLAALLSKPPNLNRSLGTDSQLQATASPRVLRADQLRR